MNLPYFNNYNLPGMPKVRALNALAMRCTKVDEGCERCWHLRMADRLSKVPAISLERREAYAGRRPAVCGGRAGEALATCCNRRNRMRPAVIAVQFMGDPWHEGVDAGYRKAIIFRAECLQEYIFLFLTKRPQNVREVLPDNCWLGTSISGHESAVARLPILSKIPCKNKWISIEPILNRIDPYFLVDICDVAGWCKFLACGPETGAKARHHNPAWISRIAEFCNIARIPFYDKRDPATPGFTRREWPREWIEKVGGGK